MRGLNGKLFKTQFHANKILYTYGHVTHFTPKTILAAPQNQKYSLIQENIDNKDEFDINCVDPLNRSALIAAIENENIELIRLLLEEGIEVKDALLHAISEEYVEAVETLLYWEEEHHESGKPYVNTVVLSYCLDSYEQVVGLIPIIMFFIDMGGGG